MAASRGSQECEAAGLTRELTQLQSQLATAKEQAREAATARNDSEAQVRRLVARSTQAVRLSEAESTAELEHRRAAAEAAAGEAAKLEAEAAHGEFVAAAARDEADQAEKQTDDARLAEKALRRKLAELQREIRKAPDIDVQPDGPSSVVVEVAAWAGMQENEMKLQLEGVGVSAAAAEGLAKMLASDGRTQVTLPTQKQCKGIMVQLESLHGLRCSLLGDPSAGTKDAMASSTQDAQERMVLESEIEGAERRVKQAEAICFQLALAAQAQTVLLEARRSEATLAVARRCVLLSLQ